MSHDAILETRQLGVTIADKTVCRQLDLSVETGQCWAVLGQNGTGKTTLLHTLAGLHQADSGEIYLNQQPLQQQDRKQRARQCGLLLQDYQDIFPASILQTVLIGRHPHLSAWQWETEQDLQLARQALAAMDLSQMEQRLLQSLSGGERRRVAIATILAQQPQLYLLDEPVNHLDIRHQHQVLKLFHSITRESSRAAVMVLHDINLAARYCSHVLMLYGDGSVEAGPCEVMLSEEKLTALYDYPIRSAGQQQAVFLPE